MSPPLEITPLFHRLLKPRTVLCSSSKRILLRKRMRNHLQNRRNPRRKKTRFLVDLDCPACVPLPWTKTRRPSLEAQRGGRQPSALGVAVSATSLARSVYTYMGNSYSVDPNYLALSSESLNCSCVLPVERSAVLSCPISGNWRVLTLPSPASAGQAEGSGAERRQAPTWHLTLHRKEASPQPHNLLCQFLLFQIGDRSVHLEAPELLPDI